jgi:hypothetical protein
VYQPLINLTPLSPLAFAEALAQAGLSFKERGEVTKKKGFAPLNAPSELGYDKTSRLDTPRE